MRLASALVLLLAALAAADEAPMPGKQVPRSLDKIIKKRVQLKYLLYLPKDYDAKAKGDKRWPLVLFLHGAGETGHDLNKVKLHGPPKLVAHGKQFPFLLVSPQAPTFGWDPDALKALLDEVKEKYRVDPDRVYVTGLSMGGFGTWALAAAYPKEIAAIAPICGGGETKWAAKIKNIPAWVFHGGKDPVVPVARSKAMVNALKKAGVNVRLTIYPEAGHDSWTETYNNPELYTWLLEQRRGQERRKQSVR
jgi:predicted peptidase